MKSMLVGTCRLFSTGQASTKMSGIPGRSFFSSVQTVSSSPKVTPFHVGSSTTYIIPIFDESSTEAFAFKNANASVLDSSKIGMIYVVDEPTWNGVTFGELDTVCTLLKNDLPGIPLIFVEAWPVLNSLQVPTSMDFIGFDRYGIYDVSTDTTFLNQLATLKSKRSVTDQKIFLVVDDQYTSGYASNGWSQDTMQYVVQHYYDLAVADTSIIGLAG